VRCTALLEGNSNAGTGAAPCPLALTDGPVRVTRSGRARVPLECTTREEDGCTGLLTLRRGARSVGSARYRLARGERKVVSLRLRRGTLRGRALRVGARARTDAAGTPPEEATATLVLRRTVSRRRVRAAARPRDRRLPVQAPPSRAQLRRSGLLCLL
jgi:hypothetical protein